MRHVTQGEAAAPKRYFAEIDICRGLGIVLVVLGHSLKQTGETNTFFEVLLSVIYSFHMPLFFVLSGFVSVKILDYQTWAERGRYIKNRAFRLLIPYFTVGILYLPLKYFLAKFAVKPYNFSETWRLFLGENPDVALWFLYFLFFISLICVCAVRRGSIKYWLFISFCFSVFAYWSDREIRLLQYLFFFILGMFLRMYYKEIMDTISRGSCICALVVLFVAANIVLYRGKLSIIGMVTALSGIAISMVFAQGISRKQNAVSGMFLFMGKYSMDIYILSEPFNTVSKLLFWSLFQMNYIICTLLCFLIGVIIPIPVSKYIVRKVKVFRAGILGIK